MYGLYGWFAMAPRGATRPRSPAIAAGVENSVVRGSVSIPPTHRRVIRQHRAASSRCSPRRLVRLGPLADPRRSRRPISAVRASAGRTRRVFSASVQRRASRDRARADRHARASTDSTSCRETKLCVSPCGVAKDGVRSIPGCFAGCAPRRRETGSSIRRSDLSLQPPAIARAASRGHVSSDLFHRDAVFRFCHLLIAARHSTARNESLGAHLGATASASRSSRRLRLAPLAWAGMGRRARAAACQRMGGQEAVLVELLGGHMAAASPPSRSPSRSSSSIPTAPRARRRRRRRRSRAGSGRPEHP